MKKDVAQEFLERIRNLKINVEDSKHKKTDNRTRKKADDLERNKADILKRSMRKLNSKYGKAILKFFYTNEKMHHEDVEQMSELGLGSENIYKSLEVIETVGIVEITQTSPAHWSFKKDQWGKYLDNINSLAEVEEIKNSGSAQLIEQNRDGDVLIYKSKQYQLALDYVGCLCLSKKNVALIEALLEKVSEINDDENEAMMDKEFWKKEKFGVQSTVRNNLERMAMYNLINRKPNHNFMDNTINPNGLNKLLTFVESNKFQDKASRKWEPPRKDYLKAIDPKIISINRLL